MLVHFASGEHPFPKPWWNIDIHYEPDQRVDLLEELPSNLVNIQWAYVGHFLEHVTPDESVALLKRIRERMVAGGRIVVIGPDAVKTQERYERGELSEALRDATLTHGDAIGNDRIGCHLWDCTGDAVVRQLDDAGWFDALEFPLGELPQRFPGVPVIDLGEWQFAATATAEWRMVMGDS